MPIAAAAPAVMAALEGGAVAGGAAVGTGAVAGAGVGTAAIAGEGAAVAGAEGAAGAASGGGSGLSGMMSRIPGVGAPGTSGPAMRALNISQFVGNHAPGGHRSSPDHGDTTEQSSSVGYDNSRAVGVIGAAARALDNTTGNGSGYNV